MHGACAAPVIMRQLSYGVTPLGRLYLGGNEAAADLPEPQRQELDADDLFPRS
jgi:hypothetical protein